MDQWKVAVVTGANSGNGFAISKKLLDSGLTVVGFDLQVDNIEKLKATYKDKVHSQVVNICDFEALKKSFQWVNDTLGGVDVLVNNAGILREGSIFGDDSGVKMEEMMKTIDINFAGIVRCSRLAFESMKKRDCYGYIINICSIAGHRLLKNSNINVYGPSKYAVNATSNVMREELIIMKNNKIRVTNVSPGLVETSLYDTLPEEKQKRAFSLKALTPEHIADTIAYLLTTPPEVNITELTVQLTGHPL